MSGSIPDLIKNHVVTAQVYEEKSAHISVATEGTVVIKTPENDKKALQELLGLSAPLEDSYLKLPKDHSNCASCGRQYSALDVAKGGVGVHGQQLVKDIVTGKYGHILNPTAPTGITCSQCGTRREAGSAAYWYRWPWYGCPW